MGPTMRQVVRHGSVGRAASSSNQTQEQEDTRLTQQEWRQVNDHLASPSEATMQAYMKFLVRAGCAPKRALQLAAIGIRAQQNYELTIQDRLSSSYREK